MSGGGRRGPVNALVILAVVLVALFIVAMLWGYL